MVFLPHTNTVILLEPYRGTITEPGLPVIKHETFQAVVRQQRPRTKKRDARAN